MANFNFRWGSLRHKQWAVLLQDQRRRRGAVEEPITAPPLFDGSIPNSSTCELAHWTYSASQNFGTGGRVQTWALQNNPPAMSISTSGKISWTPAIDDADATGVIVVGTNELGSDSSNPFNVVVDDVPVFVSAEEAVDGLKLVVGFDVNIASTTFAGFTLLADGVSVPLSGGAVNLTQITLTTDSVYQGQTLTVSYDSSIGDVTAVANGCAAASFDNESVTNSSTVAGPAPVVTTAVINTAGNSILVTFDIDVTGVSGFSGSINGSAYNTITSGVPGPAGNQITFNIAPPIYQGDTVLLAYAPGDVTRTDLGQTPLATFTDQEVDNNSIVPAPSAPEISSSAIAADGVSLSILLSEDCSGTPSLGWTIRVNGNVVTASSWAFATPNNVTATLDKSVFIGDAVSLQYEEAVGDIVAVSGGVALQDYGPATTVNQSTQVLIPLFGRDYTIPTLGDSSVFARNSLAYVRDNESILRELPLNCARFDGARYVYNLIGDASMASSESISDWVAQSSATIDGPNTFSIAAVANSRIRTKDFTHTSAELDGKIIVFSATLSGPEGAQVRLAIALGGPGFSETNKTITLSTTPKRFSVAKTLSVSTEVAFTCRVREYNLTAVSGITMHSYQVQNTTGQTSPTIPGDYVSAGVLSDPWHGLGVDGVQAFDYANGNTVDGNGVVTEAQGAPITGISFQQEPSATNLALYSNDFSSWSTYTVTGTQDQQSLFANQTAWSLEDTSGSVFQQAGKANSITLDVNDYTYLVYVKKDNDETRFPALRLQIGANNVRMKFNTKTGESTNYGTNDGTFGVEDEGDWWRAWCTLTNTNQTSATIYLYPSIDTTMTPGGQSAAALGTIIADSAQLELGSVPTSYIKTEGTTEIRAVETLYYDPVITPQTEGMVIWGGKIDEFNLSTVSFIAFAQSQYNRTPLYTPSGDAVRAHDDTLNASYSTGSIAANETVIFACRWGSSTFQVGAKINAGAWGWSTDIAYDGDFRSTNIVALMDQTFGSLKGASYTDEAYVYNVDLGTSWIEDNF